MDQSSSKTQKQILLVENSKTARVVLSRQLTDAGYEVESVASGIEALDVLKASRFDIIIMDVFLPEMNGYEATKQIRSLESELSNIPIFAYTSSQSEFDKKRCLDAGMNEFIQKSADNQILFDQLKEYLDSNKR